MRVLVGGGRLYRNRAHVFLILDQEHARRPISCIIHGAAKGADTFAEDWAKARGVDYMAFPISRYAWKMYGYSAGPMRNRRMLLEGKPEYVILFPGGTGTADMNRQAILAGLDVRRVTEG